MDYAFMFIAGIVIVLFILRNYTIRFVDGVLEMESSFICINFGFLFLLGILVLFNNKMLAWFERESSVEKFERIWKNQNELQLINPRLNPIGYAVRFVETKVHTVTGEYEPDTSVTVAFSFSCILVRTNYQVDPTVEDFMRQNVELVASVWEQRWCRIFNLLVALKYSQLRKVDLLTSTTMDTILNDIQQLTSVPTKISLIGLSQGIRYIYLVAKMGPELQLTKKLQSELLLVVKNNIHRCTWSWINESYTVDVEFQNGSYLLDQDQHYESFIHFIYNLSVKYSQYATNQYPQFPFPLPELTIVQELLVKNGLFTYPLAESVEMNFPTTKVLGAIPENPKWIKIDNKFIEETSGIVWQIVSNEFHLYHYFGGSFSFDRADLWPFSFIVSNLPMDKIQLLDSNMHLFWLQKPTHILFIVLDLDNNYLDICINKMGERANFPLVKMEWKKHYVLDNGTSYMKQVKLSNCENLSIFSAVEQGQINATMKNNILQLKGVSHVDNTILQSTYRYLRTKSAPNLNEINIQQKCITEIIITEPDTITIGQKRSNGLVRFFKTVKKTDKGLIIIPN